MEFVVDTNILFTIFWKDSFTKGILIDQDFDFISPEYALSELKKHSDEICSKTRISQKEFKELLRELAIFVDFRELKEYSKFLHKSDLIPDKDDIDFIALALKHNCPIWSNDPHLKQQSLIKVYTTDELIKEFSSK